MKKYTTIFTKFIIICACLSGCSPDLKKSMGLSKSAPDEYQVLKRPSLTVPPKFDLVPPEDDQKEGSETNNSRPFTKDQKHKVAFNPGKEASNYSNVSLTESDKRFISKSGKFGKRSNIKSVINTEHEITHRPQDSKTKKKK